MSNDDPDRDFARLLGYTTAGFLRAEHIWLQIEEDIRKDAEARRREIEQHYKDMRNFGIF